MLEIFLLVCVWTLFCSCSWTLYGWDAELLPRSPRFPLALGQGIKNCSLWWRGSLSGKVWWRGLCIALPAVRARSCLLLCSVGAGLWSGGTAESSCSEQWEQDATVIKRPRAGSSHLGTELSVPGFQTAFPKTAWACSTLLLLLRVQCFKLLFVLPKWS